MKKLILISVITASALISGITHAKDTMGKACKQSEKMMEKRMEMMKSDLKLDAKQEKAFAAFAKQKKALMKDMMDQKKAGMKGMGGSKEMQGGQMDKKGMQAQQGMRGKTGMMGMMSNLSFEERMNFMQKHAEKMTSTSKAGKNFFNSLTAEQKKKLNDMATNMKGMDGMNNKSGMGDMKNMNKK
ncbi:hypothetical protein MNBD_GAMMA21-805 [hydrothermal vent metagenome]|uniref:Uncharacterized protein n=1 Tax=hydrothermal vent metagenome TaxID=652676 RepID=A0A3B0ZXW1_9ZZZZ